MKQLIFVTILLAAHIGSVVPAYADDPEDPFGGGFSINKDAEIFTMGQQADSLHGWAFDWLSDTDSTLLINDANFPESYLCGEDRDIAAADFDGDYLDELVMVWNRPDGGVFIGIPTIDPETMAIDPGGWHLPISPVAPDVLYATPVLADVIGEIRVVAGNFYDDGSSEFVLAYLDADSMITLAVYDVDSATLTPVEMATISNQAVHTVVPEVQQFGTSFRFDVVTGDLDADSTDEIILIVSDPAQSPETDLVIAVYDYDTTSHTITPEMQDFFTANPRPAEVSCQRKVVAATGDFDGDGADELAITDDWVRDDEDTLHYGCGHYFDISSDLQSIARSFHDADATQWAHLNLVQSLNQAVYALTEYKGDLIAGGKFTSTYDNAVALNHIARWDGCAWRPLGTGFHYSGHEDWAAVHALTVYNGDLIAGGDFDIADGSAAYRIARWNGTSWEPIGRGFTHSTVWQQQVFALAVFDGVLIAGGNIYSEAYGGWTDLGNIVWWDHYSERWLPLETGMNGWVWALTVYGGDLIAEFAH